MNTLKNNVRLLSNGKLTTLITESGTGFTRMGHLSLSRWNGDRSEDAEGYFFYLRDTETDEAWSLGAQPCTGQGSAVQRASGAGVASLWVEAVAHGIMAHMEVLVHPQQDMELRSIVLANRSDRVRTIELTSYLEVVLNRQADEASHPAFSKLFVQTEFADGALLARRRPRGADESSMWMVHAAVGGSQPQFETDRTRFVGRGHTLAEPLALRQPLSGTHGNVLDPAMSLRRTVQIAPGQQVRLLFMLGAADSRDAALALASGLASLDVGAVLAQAEAAESALLQRTALPEADANHAHRLAAAVLYGEPAVRAAAQTDGASASAQLSGYGLPAGQLAVAEGSGAVVATLAAMRRYWEAKGMPLSLLVLDPQDAAIQQEDRVQLRKRADFAPQDLAQIERTAVLVVRGALPALAAGSAAAGGMCPRVQQTQAAALPRQPLRHFNGFGGFSDAGDEYVIRLDWDAQAQGLRRPPLAWTNAISNERFGFLSSDSGAGYTWSRNSRVHRLTPWYNDPISDPHGEALYLRDEDTGEYWSPLPGPAPAAADYEAVHGFGYSRYLHASHGLRQETVMFVPRHDPVKIVKLTLANQGSSARKLSLFSFQRLVLGGTPAETAAFVKTEFAGSTLLATNPQAGDFADGVTFAAVAAPAALAQSQSADRAAFIGLQGSMVHPAALSQPALDGRSGTGLDPCAAFQTVHELAPGATLEIIVLLGETQDRAEALALAERYRDPAAVQQAYEEITAFWRETLRAVQVQTPSPSIDLMLNGWLGYQNLSCRIWGRSAYYQSGGAFGFRDQLQDSSAMIYARPDLARQQIRLHAAHQFVEGDVLHWWHVEPMEQGLRTRFSDDLCWLPYITAFYVRSTGDWSVLDEVEPFLTAPLLEEGEDEVYLKPALSGQSADVYEHCCRALDRSLTKGAHGLPLMGTGDWNDGMNRVGREGRGESVWMGFFLTRIIRDFLPICERRGDQPRIKAYTDYLNHLAQALNDEGWDGAWYRRAFYDNGAVIGSKDSDECQIDALAQAWAIMSEAAPPERAKQALDAMEKRLVSERDGIIRLLTPAFVNTPHDPGYIKGYVAGVRENGGQYTHAACWAVRAMAEANRRDRAAQLLEMISPVSHALDPQSVAVYQVEPYVIAADIYGEAPHVGRGGWTWYTGSSGWMFRVGLESVLGFTLEDGNTIVLSPRIPDGWPEFSIRYRLPDGGEYAITVRNPSGNAAQVAALSVDGAVLAVESGVARIPLKRDGTTHTVDVLMGA